MATVIVMLNCIAGLIVAGMGIALANVLAKRRSEMRQWRWTDLFTLLFLGMVVAEGLQWSVGQ